jgi:hypothetical protein
MNLSDLQLVNDEVNAFPYVSDAARYKTSEFWARIDAEGGDCEDFALGKLNRLLKLGWPIDRLRLACCYVETDEYHAVLSVRGDDREYILDNRFPGVQTLDSLQRIHYRLDRIQATGGSRLFCGWNYPL